LFQAKAKYATGVFPVYKKMAGGRRKYEPTDKDLRIVEAMSGCGMPQEAIARALDIDAKTLRKHFRKALDSSADKADAQVAATLFKLATSGHCPSATFFWMKCRRGWKETTRLEHSGPDGRALVPIEAARALLEGAAASRPAEDSDEQPIKK
jgi:transposase-like protein